MSAFLAPDELAELTGSKRRRRQIAWLTEHGWKHAVNYRGAIIVARGELERQLVGGKAEATESAIRWGELKSGRKAA